MYPRALATSCATAMFADSLSPTKVTVTPFRSSAMASAFFLSVFCCSEVSDAAAATQRIARDRLARARRPVRGPSAARGAVRGGSDREGHARGRNSAGGRWTHSMVGAYALLALDKVLRWEGTFRFRPSSFCRSTEPCRSGLRSAKLDC